MVVLPGGTAGLVARETRTFEGPDGPVAATMYELSGLDLNPSYLALDPEGKLFALASPRFAILRAGYEAADQKLRDYAEQLSTDRLVRIKQAAEHEFEGHVRARNVYLFDAQNQTR